MMHNDFELSLAFYLVGISAKKNKKTNQFSVFNEYNFNDIVCFVTKNLFLLLSSCIRVCFLAGFGQKYRNYIYSLWTQVWWASGRRTNESVHCYQPMMTNVRSSLISYMGLTTEWGNDVDANYNELSTRICVLCAVRALIIISRIDLISTLWYFAPFFSVEIISKKCVLARSMDAINKRNGWTWGNVFGVWLKFSISFNWSWRWRWRRPVHSPYVALSKTIVRAYAMRKITYVTVLCRNAGTPLAPALNCHGPMIFPFQNFSSENRDAMMKFQSYVHF